MKIYETAFLCLTLLVAVVLRVWDLDRTSFFHDEGASFFQSNRPFLDVFVATAQDNYPPLHNILLWLTIKLVGTSESVLRLPSAILGTAAVYAIYRVGAEMGSRHAGLAAAALLAVLPLHVWHSIEARMYSLLAFTAICFVWATLVHWRKPSVRSAAILAFATLALLATHVYGAFAAASVDAYLLLNVLWAKQLHERRFVLWLGSQIAAGIMFAPWLLVLANRTASLKDGGFWIPYPDATFMLRLLTQIFGTFCLIVLVFLAVCFAFQYAMALRNGGGEKSRPHIGFETGLLLAWFLGPLALGFVVSNLVFPILYNRYLLVSAPAGLLLIARGTMALSLPAFVRFAVIAAMVLSLLPAAIRRVTTDRGERHDLRSATAFMMQRRQLGDTFIPVPRYLSISTRYYTGPLENVVNDYKEGSIPPPVTAPNRIWILFSWDGIRLEDQILETYRSAGFHEAVRAEYYDANIVLLEKNP